MKKALLTILLLCSLVACEGQRPELTNPDIVERDGLLFVARSTEPLTADVVRWHENGQLDEQHTLIDGKREGLWRSWYVNGQLEVEKTYINGKQEGLRRLWHENGQLWAEGNYANSGRDGPLGY